MEGTMHESAEIQDLGPFAVRTNDGRIAFCPVEARRWTNQADQFPGGGGNPNFPMGELVAKYVAGVDLEGAAYLACELVSEINNALRTSARAVGPNGRDLYDWVVADNYRKWTRKRGSRPGAPDEHLYESALANSNAAWEANRRGHRISASLVTAGEAAAESAANA
jgi:hypothetical protein